MILCVPTPLDEHREPDLSFVINTVESLVPKLRAGQIVSLESTTYPGTTDEELKPRIKSTGLVVGKDIFLVFILERDDPGNPDFTTRTIPKVVGGVTSACLEAGVSSQTVEHLYLNQALPLALSRQFELVLHASAVEIEDSFVAFLGISGRGKSTLAASFATNGHRFLTDDGLQLRAAAGGYLALPGHPSIRLWDDSRLALIPESTPAAPAVDYTPKSRLLAGDDATFCDTSRVLRCMYFLGDGNTDTVSIEPVSGRDAMIELVRHSFLLDVEEREMLTHHFGQLVEMVKMPVFFILDYPRYYEELPKVCEAVIRHAAGLSAAETNA